MDPGVSNQALLDRFVHDGDREAMSELIRRHVDFVYSTAKRQSRDAATADDVTQAVFILLVRKAHKLRAQALPAWLFRTTRYAVSNALRTRNRREKHEREAARSEMNMSQANHAASPLDQDRIKPLLDQAIASLSATERDVVIQRYLQGRNFADITQLCGATEPTVRKRLSRGLEHMRQFFARRGITLESITLSAALFEVGERAPPQVVLNSISAATVGGTVAAGAGAAIAKGVSAMLTYLKIKIAAAALVATSLVVAASAQLIEQSQPAGATMPQTQKVQPTVETNVYVGGHVVRPGAFSIIPGEERVLRELLEGAGGVEDASAPAHVLLTRTAADGFASTTALLLQDALDLPLRGGDRVLIRLHRGVRGTLRNGVSVELFGIAEHPPAGGKWWSANGEELPIAPVGALPIRLNPPGQGNVLREFVARYQTAVEGSDEPATVGVTYLGQGFKAEPNALHHFATEFPDQPTASIRFDIAAGGWRTSLSAAPDGGAEGNFALATAVDDAGNVLVTLSGVQPQAFDDARLVALLSDDREVPCVPAAGGRRTRDRWSDNYIVPAAFADVERIEYRTRPFDQWIEFRNVSLRLGNGSEVRTITSDDSRVDIPHAVRLPNNVIVQLVGLSENPSFEGSWWHQDGSVMTGGPVTAAWELPEEARRRGASRVVQAWLRLDPLPDRDATVISGMSNGIVYSTVEATGGDPRNQIHVAGFSADVHTTTVTAQVATGSWQREASFTADGVAEGGADRPVRVTSVQAFERGIQIETSDTLSTGPVGRDRRLVVQTNDGDLIAVKARSTHFPNEPTRCTFTSPPLELANVQQYHFETRPLHRVEFQNVSLKPGALTDVAIRLDGAR